MYLQCLFFHTHTNLCVPALRSHLWSEYKLQTSCGNFSQPGSTSRHLCAGPGVQTLSEGESEVSAEIGTTPAFRVSHHNQRDWTESRLTLAIPTQALARKNHLTLFWMFSGDETSWLKPSQLYRPWDISNAALHWRSEGFVLVFPTLDLNAFQCNS